MVETGFSKFVWLVIAAVVGGAVSLSYKTWLEPIFAAQSKITFSAKELEIYQASFLISNAGDAIAENVSISIWATAPFAARSDIVAISHSGVEIDATCEAGLYLAKIIGAKFSIQNALNTEAQAVLIRCERILPGEGWKGTVTYQSQEAVFGLMALVKDVTSNELLYGRFAAQN